MARVRTIEDLAAIAERGVASIYPEKTRIAVGMATCGVSSGAGKVYEALERRIAETGLDAELSPTGCIGFCQREPLIDVAVAGGPRLIYEHLTPERAEHIVDELAAGHVPAEGALCRVRRDHAVVSDREQLYPEGQNGLSKVPFFDEVPFFARQTRISLRNCGFIDPDSIDQYVGRGGYRALGQMLTAMAPEEVIEAIKASGLRGRGGAGFPTGVKWELCRKAEGEKKYVVCNADEGDPGAFMDRNILEGDPHSVIEGMTIGAYAMGASQGYIYCRAEYPLAVRRLESSIELARQYGLLGEDIFGSGFSFDLSVRAGAGAFVCGEETALMASIEGTVGEPRTRPPFPAQSGLWGNPTNINNVKTWSHVAPIIARGADWYSSMGAEKSRGTTVFSLVGKLQNTGLVEIPLGMSLREMIFDVGEGISDGGTLKAVQTGGPSGGCIPPEHLDTSITYEDLGELGSIMGSGGMIVMDESTCMVDLARYFLSFTEEESCGKCTPCREGTKRMREILDAICEGEGKPEDLDTLEELAVYVKDTALCGLGGTAPNPLLTTLKYFREEYEAHVLHRQCPSGACPALTPAPCQSTCPAGIDVPSYVALIANGQYREALDLIREDNPLPAICGYVCTHPCEGTCKRAEVDNPVAIKFLKRFAADWELENNPAPPKKASIRKDDRVAVVGSGPAGLTAAHFLARDGFDVTVFEADDEPGGMLAWAIPEFRLPREVLRYEIERIQKLGVQIETGVRIGPERTLESLREEGFKAVFLATGAHEEMRLGVGGEEGVDGVIGSLAFLRSAGQSPRPTLEGDVVVVGGGNAAVDCARVALRLGASSVTIAYRRSRQEMPADAAEVDEAEKEGVHLRLMTAPVKVVEEGGRARALRCIETKLGQADESGRRRPIPVEGSEHELPAALIITAIGQQPMATATAGTSGVDRDSRSRVRAHPDTLQTGVEWVFAGGDTVTGPATVIEGVAAGKRAAKSIARFVRGEDMTEHSPIPIPRERVEEAADMEEDEKAKLVREPMPCMAVSDRAGSFDLVEAGYTEELARAEAHRCLRCDVNR